MANTELIQKRKEFNNVKARKSFREHEKKEIDRLNGCCNYCGKPLYADREYKYRYPEELYDEDGPLYGMPRYFIDREWSYDIDHIIPLSKGGTNRLDNLTICCKNCNISKSNNLAWISKQNAVLTKGITMKYESLTNVEGKSLSYRMRHKSSYKKARRRWKEENPPNEHGFYDCALCEFWVHTDTVSINHIIEVKDRPDLVSDTSNFEPMHSSCNRWLASHKRSEFIKPPDFFTKKQEQIDTILNYKKGNSK